MAEEDVSQESPDYEREDQSSASAVAERPKRGRHHKPSAAKGDRSGKGAPKAPKAPAAPRPKKGGSPLGPKPKAAKGATGRLRPARAPKTSANGETSVKARGFEEPSRRSGDVAAGLVGPCMKIGQIATPIRAAIVLQLEQAEEISVTDLVAMFDSSQPAISHHLALLRHGGVITVRRDGKFNFYSLTDVGKTLARLLSGFLES